MKPSPVLSLPSQAPGRVEPPLWEVVGRAEMAVRREGSGFGALSVPSERPQAHTVYVTVVRTDIPSPVHHYKRQSDGKLAVCFLLTRALASHFIYARDLGSPTPPPPPDPSPSAETQPRWATSAGRRRARQRSTRVWASS